VLFVFDQHLTWSEHIDYVTSKCSKRLNLMRAIYGTRWGATTKSLITIYRALIRSVLDYGATAYDSAPTSKLQKLDRIQYSALKLCWGEMTTTSASALQFECGEAPLRLRRLQQQIKFAVKVKATAIHIAKNVFDDHWTTHYGRFSDNNKPLAVTVNQFLEDLDMTNVKGQRLGITPPWLVALPEARMRHEISWLLCHGTRSIRSTANTSRSTRTRQKTHQEKWELAATSGRSRHLQTSRWEPG